MVSQGLRESVVLVGVLTLISGTEVPAQSYPAPSEVPVIRRANDSYYAQRAARLVVEALPSPLPAVPAAKPAVLRTNQQQGAPPTAQPPRPTVVTPTPGTVAAPPPAQPTAPPRPTPSTAERAGRASAMDEASTKALAASAESLRDRILEAIAAHEKAPSLDTAREAERLRLFERLLTDVVTLGGIVTTDEAKFRADFARWQKAGGEAAPVYRQAESEFHRLALEAEFPEEKALLEKASTWYAARAARLEIRSQTVIPTEFDTEIRRIRKMTAACEVLQRYVRIDPHFMDNDEDFKARLTAFMTAFRGVGNVLDQWTKKLLEDMEQGKDEKVDAAASVPAVATRPS